MTDLLDRAMDRARVLSPEMQDEVARMILSFAGDDGQIISLADDERAAIERSLDAAARGDFATEAEVEAVWVKRGP